MPLTAALFDLDRVPAPLRELLETERPWDVLARLDAFGASLLDDRVGTVHPTAIVEGPLVIEEGAVVGPYAYLTGPVYLAAGAHIGHAARVRGPVVLGPGAKVMHASEVKRSLFLGGAKAPHFNYVGDSVIGHDVNLGAGVKLANTKAIGSEIVVAGIGTGMRKLGSLLGDGVSIGCNAVLSPGTVIGKRTVVYDGADVRGVIAEDRIVKHRSALEETPRRP